MSGSARGPASSDPEASAPERMPEQPESGTPLDPLPDADADAALGVGSAPTMRLTRAEAPDVPFAPASSPGTSAHEACTSAASARPASSSSPSVPSRPVASSSHHLDRSSTGLSPRVAATLCYLAAWIGGLLFLTFERRSPFVCFHAWQSVLGLGGLFALGVGLWTLAMMMAFVSAGAFSVFAWMAEGAWAVLALTWVALLVSAARGARWKLPVIGRIAERRAASLAG